MAPRIGSLFSGFGGLDLGLMSVFPGAEVAWHSEIDPAACRILDARWPGVPNLGDITTVDWACVEPVDVLSGGFPCMDVSLAGARAGLLRGETRSGLWGQMATAISVLRPSLVVIENVRGLLSAKADSDVEPCPWCLGDTGGGEPALRALGAVLADLADLGFDAEWRGLRAADAGAPHGRFRVFIVAWPADTDGSGLGPNLAHLLTGKSDSDGGSAADAYGTARPQSWGVASGSAERAATEAVGRVGRGGGAPAGAPAEDTNGTTRGEWREPASGQAPGRWARSDPRGPGGARPAADPDRYALRQQPVPVQWRSGQAVAAVPGADAVAHPTGARRYGAENPGADREDAICWTRRGEPQRSGDAPADAASDGWDEGRPEPAGNGGGSDAPVSGAPAAADSDSDGLSCIKGGQPCGCDADGCCRPDGVRPAPEPAASGAGAWGQYAAAVARWEAVIGRPAPAPTEPGRDGKPRLSPRAVEWMMGLPDGWVCDVPGISRNDQLKALGNGVVPQQAAAALAHLMRRVPAISQEGQPQ